MLCDKLKVYVPQDGTWGLEPEEGGKLVEEETCYLKSEVDAAIAELKAKLEDVQATAYADSVDAGMRERRLKRALYKACANWAKSELRRRYGGYPHEENGWFKMQTKCRAMAEKFK